MTARLPEVGQVDIKKIIVDDVPHYAFTTITDNNMLLASIVPESELIQAMTKQSLNVFLILTILCFIITIAALNLIDRILNKPIEKIIFAAEQINQGLDSGFDVSEANDVSDEISSLLQSLNGLIKRNNITLMNLLNSITAMLFVVDVNNFKINYINKHMRKVFPMAKENALCYEALFNFTEPCPNCPIVGLTSFEQRTFPEIEIFDKSKNQFFKLQTTLVEWNGAAHYALMSIYDVTKDVAERERLEEVAETDPLTGILNRRGGIAALERIIAFKENSKISVVSVDLNGLKYVNDNFGHSEGDFYLNSFVQAVIRSIRGDDIVSRLGGDEFLIVLPSCKEENALALLKKVNEDLQKILVDENKDYPGSIAYGVQEIVASPSVDIQEVFDRADEKMYLNKQEYYKNKEKN